MEREIEIVMLPTEGENGAICHYGISGKIKEAKNKTPGGINMHLYFVTNEGGKEGDWCIELHEGKWYARRMNMNWEENDPECKRIVATTDSEVRKIEYEDVYDGGGLKLATIPKNRNAKILPKIPMSFVSEYAKADGKIDNANVEYEDYEECHNYGGKHLGKDCSCKGGDFRRVIKVTDDNEVIITTYEH